MPETLVASPKHNGNKPVANGSKLPVCPALLALNKRRTSCKALLEETPKRLSNNKIPFTLIPEVRLLIFFFSEHDDRYIMDQWTAKSINYLWDAPIVPMSGDMPDATQCTGEIYERFCGCIDELAQIATRQRNEDRSWTGEQIEQRLFSVGGRRPGAFRRAIREWFSNKNVNKSEKKNDSYQTFL